MSKFIWLRGNEIPRKGPPLKNGQEHAAKDYPAEVVKYWIESGVAKPVEPKPKKKEKD